MDSRVSAVAIVLGRARQIRAALAQTGSDDGAVRRLDASVIRPLAGAGGAADGAQPVAASDDLAALAYEATVLRRDAGGPAELLEAVAALQELACTQSAAEGTEAVAAREATYDAALRGLPSDVRVARNGPLLVTNVRNVRTWLGEPAATRAQLALCRCGASATKPYCDGSHATSGFSDAKDPKRIADRRDTYVGQQITILDNRGTCQHAGSCTDRLPTVFRARAEPFVAPSGGRADEIVRAVRDCRNASRRGSAKSSADRRTTANGSAAIRGCSRSTSENP